VTLHHDSTAPVADLGDADFDDAIRGRWTAVDLWATWCGPCRRFMPAFEEAARRNATHAGALAFARVNVDDNPAVAERVAPRCIPTVVLYDPDGNEVTRASGFLGADDLDGVLAHLPDDLR
jgi:thioredoxin-like negative regulator of GroEL